MYDIDEICEKVNGVFSKKISLKISRISSLKSAKKNENLTKIGKLHKTSMKKLRKTTEIYSETGSGIGFGFGFNYVIIIVISLSNNRKN